MPTVIAQHQVKDTERWLASTRREEALGRLGASNIRTFVSRQDPQQVAVLMAVADLDALMGALDSPEMASAVEHDGVRPETISALIAS